MALCPGNPRGPPYRVSLTASQRNDSLGVTLGKVDVSVSILSWYLENAMKRSTFVLSVILATYVLLAPPGTAHAIISCSGDVDPANPIDWNIDTNLHVGQTGHGTVDIMGGGTAEARYSYLGHYANSSGIVTVSGPGSTWTNSATLYVGGRGSGTLTINDGGAVSNRYCHVGFWSSSTGAVTVAGSSSTWTTTGIGVGFNGDGTLTIRDGGTVTADGITSVASNEGATGTIHFGPGGGTLSTTTLLASSSQLAGAGTIYTCGIVTDIDVTFDAVSGLTPELRFHGEPDQDITVNVNMSDPDDATYLGAGYEGRGSLTIRDHLAVQSSYGFIGYQSGSMGTATVSGIGSTWTNTTDLHVGYHGNGSLVIDKGGAVVDDTGYVGYSKGSVGEVRVCGAGSKWTNRRLRVGWEYDGAGVLTISDGGTVVTEWSGTISAWANATGEVKVTGPDSRWIIGRELAVGGSGIGALWIQDGGLVSVGQKLKIDSSGRGESSVDMSSGGMLALFGNADTSLSDFLNLIEGTDAIRYWDNSIPNWAPITDAAPGIDYTLAYIDDPGSDLYGYTVLTVGMVPEPDVILVLLIGAAMLLTRRASHEIRA